MLYTLSYVNLRNETIQLDQYFIDFQRLEEWVRERYPDFTSYQVIVTSQRP